MGCFFLAVGDETFLPKSRRAAAFCYGARGASESCSRRNAKAEKTAIDVEAKRPARKALEDLVDDTIRSEKTLEVVRDASSALSRRWHVVSALQVEDFVEALRASQ